MFESMINALKTVDSKIFFGSDRPNLVLNIWKGDQSDKERFHFAKLLATNVKVFALNEIQFNKQKSDFKLANIKENSIQ